MRTHSLVPLLGLAGALALSGCSAVTSTTNTAADVAESAIHGISASTRQSTDASVTEPDTPRHRQAVAFVDTQRPQLAREAARGGGEHVDALAGLLGESDRAAFGHWLQAHYDHIFTGSDDAEAVVTRITARRG